MLVVYKFFPLKEQQRKIVGKTLIFKYKLFIQATTTWINKKKIERERERNGFGSICLTNGRHSFSVFTRKYVL